jgi:hypothetical protein
MCLRVLDIGSDMVQHASYDDATTEINSNADDVVCNGMCELDLNVAWYSHCDRVRSCTFRSCMSPCESESDSDSDMVQHASYDDATTEINSNADDVVCNGMCELDLNVAWYSHCDRVRSCTFRSCMSPCESESDSDSDCYRIRQ